ncbi:MAG: hypothetical protein AAFN13_14125 [Bacteroidota bacterium]
MIVSGADVFPAAPFLAAVAGGPLIGIGIYLLSTWTYTWPKGGRLVWSIFSVWLAGTALFTVLVFADSRSLSAIREGVGMMTGAFIWLMVLPPAWLVFVMAYANHEWIRRLSGYGDEPTPRRSAA